MTAKRLMDERILDYGVPPLQQRRFYRRLVRAAIFLSVVATIYFVGPSAWRWGEYLYWQERCLNYIAPPTLAVYDSSSGHEVFSPCVPEAQFSRNGGVGDGSSCGIFVHAMHRPDGTKCLVELNLDSPVFSNGFKYYWMEYCVWIVSPVANFAHGARADFTYIDDRHKWRIYAGQPDPTNATHFTFDYEINGQRHTCDAWLNNSNQLVLSTRP